MKRIVDISIIIVNFNTRSLLQKCLQALESGSQGKYTQEIIVVDNGSSDNSADMVRGEFPTVTLIGQSKNLGYAVANNIGIKKSKGKYVLLLNSDTQVSTRAIHSMFDFMGQHKEAGAATCRVVLPGGSMDPACHRGFPTPWAALTYFLGLERLFPSSRIFGQYHQGYKDMTTSHEIDSPSGAFYFIRRKVIDQIGLLDEDYFMYGEDLDWSYRIKKAGWKIFYNPDATAIHHKKQSGRLSENNEIRDRTRNYFYDTMRLFYQKHYHHRYGWLMTKIIFLGIRLRSVL